MNRTELSSQESIFLSRDSRDRVVPYYIRERHHPRHQKCTQPSMCGGSLPECKSSA
jgi:hypothetical protein